MSQSCSSQSSPSSTNERGNGEHSQCFEADAPLDAILSCIELHHKVLILMRGLPGSGKSYLARNLEKRGLNGRVFSTDDFFCSPNGSYVFDQNKLSDYHAQNVGRVRDAIGEDRTPVIVDNTNVFGVHMKPYANLAVKSGYEVYFVEPDTKWKFNVKECFRKNLHLVEKSTIQYMLDNYEKKVSLEHLIRPIKLQITAGCGPASRAASEPAIGLLVAPRPSSASSGNIGSDAESRSHSRTDTVDSGSPISKSQTETAKAKASASTQEVRPTTPSKRAWKLPDGLLDGLKSGLEGEEHSSTPPLATLSLEPPSTTLKVWCASRAVQISDCRLLLANIHTDLLGPPAPPEVPETSDGIACDESFLVEQPKKRPPRSLFKDRAVQTADCDQLTALDQLVAIFPDEDVEQLAHVIDSCGGVVEQAIAVLLDGGGCARREGRAATVGAAAAGIAHSSSSEEYAVDMMESAAESDLNESSTGASFMQQNGDDRHSTFSLVLDERVADSLQRAFGPITPEGLPAELLNPSQRRVSMPLGFAMKLHQMWMQTQSGESSEEPSMEGVEYYDWAPLSTANEMFGDLARPTHKDRLLKSDEAYARLLQEHMNAEDQGLPAQRNVGASVGSMTLAEQLKLDKLYNMFPTFDRLCVKDIYDTNSRSFDQTKKTLQQYLGVDAPSSSGMQPEPAITYSLAFDGKRSVDEHSPQGPLDYGTLHEESKYHAQKRNECYVKAKNAFQERKSQVAAYYAQEGRNHDRLMNDANDRAKKIVVNTRARINPDNLLDLHGLHVDEALETLKKKLDSFDRPVESRNGLGRKLLVVTGHGLHSKGSAKLKPAINQWLRQKGYKFEQSNPGEVSIYCK